MSQHLIVAEDDPQQLELIVALLQGAGFTLIICHDGEEALKKAQETLPVAIVSDALMPRLDGFQLCLAIRRDPALCNLPFILYTATYTEKDDENFAREIGCDAFVRKPEQSPELVHIIRANIARNAAREPRAVRTGPLDQRLIENYAHRSTMKLESKLLELHKAHAELRASHEQIAALNQQANAAVAELRLEIDARTRVETLLSLALNVADMGAWSRDYVSGRPWLSPAFRQLFNLPEGLAELNAELLETRVAPEDQALVARMFSDQRGSDQDFDFEARLRLRPEGERWFHVRSEVFRENGIALRRVGVIADITARKHAELERQILEQRLRESQKMEALGTFAAGIAHDFNNILAAILSSAELLQLTNDPTAAADIEKAAHRGRELVEQIMNFSRQRRAPLSSLTLAPVLDEVVRLLRPMLGAQTTLEDRIATNLPAIKGNATQLHQVFLNLLSNSLQAIEGRTGGRVAISADIAIVDHEFARHHPPLRPGRAAHVRVSDNGHGIAPEHLPRIFEPFFSTKGERGNGLGLATVHGLVIHHEGAITVQSTPGQGTTFELWFPESTETPPTAASAPADKPGRGQSILIVDDEPSVGSVAAKLLHHLGFRTEAMSDPLSARDRLMAEPLAFDLVLTDYSMPGLNGVQLAQSVWGVRAELPFVMMAGYGGRVDAIEAKRLGFRDLIAKPFTLRRLSEAIALGLRAQ